MRQYTSIETKSADGSHFRLFELRSCFSAKDRSDLAACGTIDPFVQSPL